MFLSTGRSAVSTLSRFAKGRSALLTTIFLAGMSAAAHAVVVRGHVTDALGRAVPGARVQLIEDGKMEAIAYAGPDGTYEIRYSNGGRFTLLGSAGGFFPEIGQDFYGGVNDVLNKDVVLATNTVKQDVAVTATGIPTPLPELTAPVSVIPGETFATHVGVVDEMRQTPGAFLVQTGQYGGVTSLFMRGAPSDANKVLIDGVPGEDVGGVFDFGTVSSTGVGQIEMYRGPNSALVGSDSQGSVISVTTPKGFTLRPLFNYSGDAGNLHTWRNEATIAGAHSRLDYFGGFSRFDSSNALAYDRYHSSTSVTNIGVALPENTTLRFTIRDAVSAEGLPDAHDFFGVSQDGKEGDQDLYSGATLENRTKDNWHNLVRYTIARKTEQANAFAQPGTLGTVNDPFYGSFPGYFGNVVTIRGANGYSATGAAQMYQSTDYKSDTNRDELYYQSDYVFPKNVVALFGFRYDNERGTFNTTGTYAESEQTQRTNFEYNLQLQGDIKSRVFYSLGGSLQKNHLYGVAGTPRLGLAYVPVRPGHGYFHGTKLRVNFATGVQEPSLATEFDSLYDQLERYGDTTDIGLYHIAPLGPERSRTADIGLDQNIIGQKLILKLGYFHNQFSHQLEDVYSSDLATYFGFNPTNLNPSAPFYDAEVNSMAYRAQGIETQLQWQMTQHMALNAGYTYLDAVVERSFTGDVTAVLQGFPTQNPNMPGVDIGALSPLIGARPFRRPPHTGFFGLNYSRQRFTMQMQGAMASRSDDSTYLLDQDDTDGNTLLLPNRNLDFGYVKLDLGAAYRLRRHIQVFTQLNNLLNDQHIGPIGYPGLPFTFRTGLKLQLGGD
jgi:vitamin B12 transporter